ncbi:polyphosphate kinase 1 [Candidatus Tachikawaea gelatinosa]|uniref:Polyphosphate kinase n=1 Tax=Candidatus Tachikawaea gelatinosa TaxID=1410383 RepID=A0A090BWD7_9ENTR|nr:polyphosphate kinase 1 [Candidatus Tachikawaea gelatinosa]BAP58426.1 polyphosphate kinase [Candidatus Tachikawaea gelatinosa]
MIQKKQYLEKELSWLSFNERVLQEVADKKNDLLERLYFLGIYSNNLDEFYKVRFSELKRNILIKEEQSPCNFNNCLLEKIQEKVLLSDKKFNLLYNNLLLEMARNQIFLINENQLSHNQKKWLHKYFNNQLKKYIIPIIINDDTNLTKFLKDDYTYLAIEIIKNLDKKIRYALIEIPSDKISRFILLRTKAPFRNKPIILLDNIIRYFLEDIFKSFFDYDQINAYSIKITRDAEYDLVAEMESSLIELMSSSLKKRLTAKPVRFIYQKDMPLDMIKLLCHKLSLSNYDSILPGNRYHNFKDFIKFPSILKKKIINPFLPQIHHIDFRKFRNKFNAIRKRDIILYYPYHTFEHVLELLQQASFDPHVIAIKINIYRVARNSRIINSIIHSAYNGKKVTVVVELQARFDEAANINWAKQLTEAGVHVIFSAPGLKIHAKLFLISRREKEQIVHYAHIGTGNFNEKTAKSYTDYSLLTADSRITNEVRKVFHFIENPYRPVQFDYLIVSPQNSRNKLYQLIDNEINFAKKGYKASIILKLNNLSDQGLINRLYKASKAGVKVYLLVRSMCSLIPQLKGISENIYAISIIDRYLEHDRIYAFENKGNKKVFISSADWMTRNIDYRIEVAVSILDNRIKNQILDIVKILFSDTVKARILDKEMSNKYVLRGKNHKVRAQISIYKYIKKNFNNK